MAFTYGSPAAPGAGGGADVQNGPDLEDIQTEALGFLALSGDSKVQLLPSPWPSDALPPPTASLMSVASQKGLVAAAGPDAVIVATTESVRRAFEGPVSGDGNLKPFTPQLNLPMPMRISQVAFSADESYLVLSAETGGGLAVYEVQSLLNGSTQSAFELSTNGISLRALVPNPTPERGELIALITTDGNLMMANLKERSLITGPNGQVLKDGVSCISWSTKGKQLVAGLGNGTAYQMTPEGEGKAEIPRPPGGNSGDHISSISWLENNVFLVVHTPTQFSNSEAPASTFHLVTRQPPSSFKFQKFSDPAGPFGLNRSPPHHFILRLKSFPPKLQDVLIIASTASTDIGLLSRSETPLTNDKPADKVSGVFTMTEMANDSRRAQLPLSAELGDTSPIGLALDLSSKEKVAKPIPGDEIDESPTPLPALMVLNNDGALASWWIVYSDSIRQNTIYPGLTSAGAGQQTAQPSTTSTMSTSTPFGSTKPAFSAPAFGAPAFGTPKPTTTFGAPSLQSSTTGAFGAPSGLGKNQSPWGTSTVSTTTTSSNGPTFGSSTFGSTSSGPSSTPAFGAPAFGATSTPAFGLGNRPSPWSTGGSTAPNAAFGQSGGLGKPTPVFGSSSQGGAASSGGGFSAFASQGGFASAAAAGPPNGSIFSSKPTSNPFAPKSESANAFGQSNADKKSSALFGPSGFVLGSTFKADNIAKDDASNNNDSKTHFFGGNFGSVLAEASAKPSADPLISEETDMNTDEALKQPEPLPVKSTTPTSTPAPPKTPIFPSSNSNSSGLFGNSSTPLSSTSKPKTAAFDFGQSSSEKPKSGGFNAMKESKAATFLPPKTPVASQPLIPDTQTPSTPQVKQESISESPINLKSIAEAPLPPDITSKATFGAGESSASSAETDAPLPPDFIPKKGPQFSQTPSSTITEADRQPKLADLLPPNDVPKGPEDKGDESGFMTEEDEVEGVEQSEEGSGEDVAKDLSPTSELNQTPGFTPENSFGIPKVRAAESNIFKQSFDQTQDKKVTLFGENQAPILPPPRTQVSPRSPSPVRNALPGRLQRPDTSRSVSAPGVASQILGSRGLGGRSKESNKSTYIISKEEREAEEKQRRLVRAQREAEETRTLVNQDDERIQAYLTSDTKSTRRLDEFITHSDYVGFASIESIPAQVEAVYRDINAMIDTLGINAKALQNFVQGHEDYRDEPRSKEDLDDDENWCLVEVENLSVIVEKELGHELELGQITAIAEKLETCNNLQRDIVRLRAKHNDIKKLVLLHRDPTHMAHSRAQPLGAEQLAQQNELRRDFTRFQKLLSETEEGLTVIKAKIVSQAASTGRNTSSTGPTVDAVMRTIMKMTNMVEKRSGDIDVLEGQMRRLRFNSVTSAGSREGSPYATPQNSKPSFRNLISYGLSYTPENSDLTHRFQNSLRSSTGSFSRSSPGPRKKLSGYTIEEKVQLKVKLARRKEVTDRLKATLQKAGTNVRLMGDDD